LPYISKAYIYPCLPGVLQVTVNGVDYQPSITSNNKKLAKAQAATVCLQEFGLVPRTELSSKT